MKRKWMTIGLLAGLLLATPLVANDEIVIKPYQTGDEKRVDNPVDAMMNAHAGPAGTEVKGNPGKTLQNYRRREVLANDAKNGDFSIAFTVTDPKQQSAFGMSCGDYIDHWEIGEKASLHLWFKIADAAGTEPVSLVLYDAAGKRAVLPIEPAKLGEWQELDVALRDFKGAEDFDFSALRSVQGEAALPKATQVWLDDVYFHEGKTHLGVTDKTITQMMAETAATRPARVAEALESHGQRRKGTYLALSKFYQGNTEEGNRLLLEELQNPEKYNYKFQLAKQLPEFYFAFSSKGIVRPDSLSPEVERELLAAMRHDDELINDIALPRHSVWYVVGSENLDYHKRYAMFCSQIYRNEPAYADLPYPNPGTTLGFSREDTWLHWINVWSYAVTERGNYSDGKSYTAKDHYLAWTDYWKRYMAERARCGFFAENNADGAYGIVHFTNYLKIYTWTDDEVLREQARMFLDLNFAKSLQDQMLLIQGGSMGRGLPGSAKNAIPQFTWCFLGGASEQMQFLALTDYAWPRVLWEMALDRKGRGEYVYVSRKPNEAQQLVPRPEGTDNVILTRRDSRIVNYSFVTPDYVMGLRMDLPTALYQHCCLPNQGIIFSTDQDATIWPLRGAAYNLVQDRCVALLAHKRYVTIQHPVRFPPRDMATVLNKPTQVLFGQGVDHIEEQDGWVFIQEEDAYGAFRFVSPADTEKPIGRDARGLSLFPVAADNYVLEENGKQDEPEEKWTKLPKGGMRLAAKESYVPLVIEMSRKANHPTLEDFKKDVLDNPLLIKTSNMYFGYLVSYRGCGPDARELELNLISGQTPRIDGKQVSYDAPAFDSPWLKGPFDRGVVTLIGPISGKKLVYDFNKRSSRKEIDQ